MSFSVHRCAAAALWHHNLIRHFIYLIAAASPGLGITGTAYAQPAGRGQKQFVEACGFCHGADATGSRGPDLVRSPLVNRDTGGDLIAPVAKLDQPTVPFQHGSRLLRFGLHIHGRNGSAGPAAKASP